MSENTMPIAKRPYESVSYTHLDVYKRQIGYRVYLGNDKLPVPWYFGNKTIQLIAKVLLLRKRHGIRHVDQ